MNISTKQAQEQAAKMAAFQAEKKAEAEVCEQEKTHCVLRNDTACPMLGAMSKSKVFANSFRKKLHSRIRRGSKR